VRHRLRLGLRLVWALFVVCGVIVIILHVLSASSPEQRTEIATAWATVIAAVALIPPALVWIWRTWPQANDQGSVTPEQRISAADHLAERALTYWEEQARRQGIGPTSPIAVRWRSGPSDLAPANPDLLRRQPVRHPNHQQPQADQAGGGPPPPAATENRAAPSMTQGVVTAWYDELYTRLGNDVLVVLGPPGAGKSGALLLLMLEALQRRHELSRKAKMAVPVPVWITCGSWNPETTTLAEHVVEVLTRDYPGLTSTDLGGRVAPLALIDHGQLAVFLDGLDEMPQSLRTAALVAITLQAGRMPVVLTSRTEEYRAAVGSGRFRPAAVIELRPVDPAAATAYLTDRQSAARVSAWQPVLDQIRNEPDSALSKVLSTPLGLALARDTYANVDPANLLQSELSTPTAVLNNILGAFLEHAYPDRRIRDYAIRWMSWIALHMSPSAKGATRDLPWWHLPRWIPALRLGLIAGLATGVVSTAVAAFAYLIGGGLSATTEALKNGESPFWVAAVAILAPGIMAGLATCLLTPWVLRRTRSPQALVPRLPRSTELPLMLSTALAAAVITLLTPLLLVAFQFAVLHMFVNHEITFENHYNELLVLFILLAVPVGLLVGVLRVWRTPVAELSAGTPYSTYRADRRAARLGTLLVGAAAGLGIVMAVLIESPFKDATRTETFIIGLLALLQSVAIFGWLPWATAGAAPQLRVAQVALRLSGRGRVQFIPLLEDALVRQVLRQAGTMYQLRHAALQDYLVTRTGLNVPF
jgi:hypothetical protein